MTADEKANILVEKASILVVDDLPEKLLVYRTVLEELGQHVVTAFSGAEALRQVLQHDFAVILLDVNMPDMDGFETASLIRKRKKSMHTPIIFVTAQLDELRAVQAYAHGAVDYILAPIAPEVFRAKVKVFVDLFHMHQQARKQAEESIILAEERAKRAAAEEADRRKDEFLAMLSHELRNPLAPICNAVEIIRRVGPTQPEVQQAHAVIDRQLENLTRLVDDLLDVSRITSGKIRLKLENLDVAVAVRTAVETSQPLIDSRRQHLSIALPSRRLRVQADHTRLAQVMSNLLNNAAKYTPERGHIWLTVADDDGEVLIQVRDDGAGIPAEILPHIFDLFTQADQSLDRAQGGLGIGLTLVRRLVELHHGSVQAQSRGLGQGSEFIVRLPALIEEAAPPKPRNGFAAALPVELKRRILVVDDNLDTAESLAMLMRFDGHEVLTAHDGLAALKVFDAFSPQVVILDIGLPNLDGYEVARRLRLRGGDQTDLLLAALTGYGNEEDQLRSQQAGFDHHLVKPVRIEALRQLLAAH